MTLIISLCTVYVIISQTRGNEQKKRLWQVSLMGFLLFAFAALRSYTVGTDLETYFSYYYADANSSISEIWVTKAGRDPFFHCFLHALSWISSSPQFMLVVIGAIVAFGFSYFVYHSPGNVLVMYMLFIGLRVFSFTLSGLRQSIAMGLVFVATVFLFRDKKYRFFATTMLASMFHISALCFLFAFFFVRIRKVKAVAIWAIVASVINYLTSNSLAVMFSGLLFSDRFGTKVLERTEFEGTTTFFIYLIVFFIALFVYNNMKVENKSKYMILFTIGVMFSMIGQTIPNVFRIAYYFIISLLPIFCSLISTITSNKQTANLLNWLAVIFLAIQYLIFGTSAGTDNYIFFWEMPYV